MFHKIEEELTKRENASLTENGAVGYKSSGSSLLDLNYQVSSLRDADEYFIAALLKKAFEEDPEYTLKWLFFARDIREGLGERRLFRICYSELLYTNANLFCKNLKYIPEFGRWDDLISLIGLQEEVDEKISEIIQIQLVKDLEGIKDNKKISLLGKWLPSENASSPKTKKLAKKIRKMLNLSPKRYRKVLSRLRKYLNIVEREMCSNQWETIDYEKVPSLANLKYKDAFLKHDLGRRREYLDSVQAGTSRMNMNVATPVDVVSKYMYSNKIDDTLELAWKNLKDVNIKDTLVVADGSGSMLCHVGGGSTKALDVAIALAIYTSEHNTAPYRNKYITFSNSPQFVNLSKQTTLKDKIREARQHCEVSNTNIEAVFKLILKLAIETRASQDEMIKNVLIISDMEFDAAQRGWRNESVLTQSLFEEIQKEYINAGYKMPKLIFWNVNSRTKLIPILENELGVTLVSGFSQNVLKMVMSEKYNPLEVLYETLDQKRYEIIETH